MYILVLSLKNTVENAFERLGEVLFTQESEVPVDNRNSAVADHFPIRISAHIPSVVQTGPRVTTGLICAFSIRVKVAGGRRANGNLSDSDDEDGGEDENETVGGHFEEVEGVDGEIGTIGVNRNPFIWEGNHAGAGRCDKLQELLTP